jgi:hypothetical protein
MKYNMNTGEFVTNSTTFTALTVPHENVFMWVKTGQMTKNEFVSYMNKLVDYVRDDCTETVMAFNGLDG